jgi:hypothetical protein
LIPNYRALNQSDASGVLSLSQTGPVRLMATVAVTASVAPFRAVPAAPVVPAPVGASSLLPTPAPARTVAVTGQGPLEVHLWPDLPVAVPLDRDPLVTMAAGEPGELRPRDDPRPMPPPRRVCVGRA